MIKAILFASFALALVGGGVQAQQGAPRHPQKLEKSQQLATERGFSRRAEEERDKVAQAGVRDRLHAWEAKLTRRFVERPFRTTHRFTLAAIRRRPQREVKSLRPRGVK
ncbi:MULTISPECIES: hypothetical protein [unclassified Bradyrhizobium]|uniref:hypothetical protein n=1 Tax=unclassified Bradyrhizobium TaxID=2631580 RepID=UPI001FF99214|nr:MULTISPECIES: hypothetical protein [unclassified Bradyrhizobium]MCK1323847.1 hypothetical protein [Bradyrhizobium sp. 156]MCK1354931.1 hypothetical protein [Bradyrhizobium sp. CW7]MCK1412392.1 hypothetical protein [Bradyrhizobium sp. CW4]MCK1496924.1 hypothetical protein [Bradyrhizobium sp. 188]MCK1568457.1 hypothetical protein [Bradyrhizobium sp. 173]